MENACVFEIKSNAFNEGEFIPIRYTGFDEDVSPALEWKDPPDGTMSFVLICDDPDAPMGNWVHWVIYNIPGDTRSLPEGMPTDAQLEQGIYQGINDFGRPGYGGPMPPPGKPHRYIFTLYALDIVPQIQPGITKEALLRAINGHIIEKTYDARTKK